MKWMRALLWCLMAFALLGIGLSLVAEQGLRKKAQQVQIVSGTIENPKLDGEPIEAIVVPPITGRELRPDGVAVLNREKDNGAHQFIPVSTVSTAASRARMGAVAAIIVAALGLLWFRTGYQGPFQRPDLEA